jgi:hypothetical protein
LFLPRLERWWRGVRRPMRHAGRRALGLLRSSRA